MTALRLIAYAQFAARRSQFPAISVIVDLFANWFHQQNSSNHVPRIGIIVSFSRWLPSFQITSLRKLGNPSIPHKDSHRPVAPADIPPRTLAFIANVTYTENGMETFGL